jgi:hypothetical protein
VEDIQYGRLVEEIASYGEAPDEVEVLLYECGIMRAEAWSILNWASDCIHDCVMMEEGNRMLWRLISRFC